MEELNSEQRKVLEQAVNESAKNFFDNAPCGYLFTSPGGDILKINKTLSSWLGYEATELVGKKNLRDVISGGGKIFYETHYAPLLMMQGFVNEINFLFTRKDGTTFPVLINSTQNKNEKNKPLFNSLVVIDYSDRKKYEKELIIARKKAVASDEAKTLFLSTISHEILTPLNAILNCTNLLNNTTLTEEQKELTSLLDFSSKNLLALLNDLLFVSKSELGVYNLEEKDFSMAEIGKNLMRTYQLKIKEKNLELEWFIDELIPEFLIGDQVKIIQVLSNLLNNAIKFTQQGTIRLEISLTSISQGVAKLYFEVSDTGMGIEEAELKNIFQPFSQANQAINSQFGGSGLGLSICKDIVAKYNSQIHVESELNKGSCFSFYLALKISPTKINSDQVQDKLQKLPHLKVLLVEDNEANAFLAAKYFKNWKLGYDRAKNGQEAIDKIIANDYDLVLMDLKMPIMDGYETTSIIRKMENPDKCSIPIIAFSAVENATIKQRMEKFKINGFVQKPFQPEILHQSIVEHSKTNVRAIPEVAAEKASPNIPKSATADTTIDLSNLYETFDQEENSVKEFVQILLPEFLKTKKDLISAVSTTDIRLYRDAVHKLQSSISVLNANRLRHLLAECRKLMEDFPDQDHQLILDKIVAEMDLYATELKGIINS